MSEVCCKRIYGSMSYKAYPCGRPAKVEHEGLHYCGVHDPVKRKAKQEERDAKWKKERDEQQAARDKAAAEASEQKRRADCYEDLLDALGRVLGWAAQIAGDNSDEEAAGEELDSIAIARAAIARATGESP